MNATAVRIARWTVTCALLAVFAGCSLWNDVSQDCRDVPSSRIVSIGPKGKSWLAGTTPAAVTPEGKVYVAYGFGPNPAVLPQSVGAAVLDARNLAPVTQCSADGKREAVDDGWDASLHLPSVSFALDGADMGALAYRGAPASDAASDEIRFTFLTPAGCIMSRDDGDAFLSLEHLDATRVFSMPQVAHTRDTTFAVVWISASRNENAYDDRLRGRLVSSTGLRFPANAQFRDGAPMEIDVGDRVIMTPLLVSFRPAHSDDRRIALLWYGMRSGTGYVQLTLLDERLQRISDIKVLGQDHDVDDALTDKTIAASYDEQSQSLFVVWNQGQAESSSVVGTRVAILPTDAQPGSTFSLSDPADGAALGPTVTHAPSGEVLVAWRNNARIVGLTFDADGGHVFDGYGCGTRGYEIARIHGSQLLNPLLFVSGDHLVTLFSEKRADGTGWSVDGVVRSMDELLPGR